MATNTNPFYTYSATAGSSKTLQKPQDGGDNNQWGNYINTDLDEIVSAVNALSDKIADASENTLVDFTATTDAVNHVGVTNAATGNPPQISSAGSDTNVDLTLTAQGTGDINLTPGTNGDVNIPASKGITFGDDGEKIEGDGTDLTIASSATLNVNTGSASGNDLKINTTQLVVEGDTGQVGVGTSDPISPVQINVNATDSIPTNQLIQQADDNVLVLRNTNNSANYSGIKLEVRSSGASGWLIANEWQSTYLGDLVFRGRSDGSNSAERMRIDSSGNLKINSGYGSVATAYACRAWVNFDGTNAFSPNPSTSAIRGSGNVSSITYNGTGDYTVNFTNAMPDDDFAVTSIGSNATGSYNGTVSLYAGTTIGANPMTTSSVRVRYTGNGGLGSFEDVYFACIAIFR